MDYDDAMLGGSGSRNAKRQDASRRRTLPAATSDQVLALKAREALTSSGCLIIDVRSIEGDTGDLVVEIDGDFSDFAACARSLAVPAIFLECAQFDETEFEGTGEELEFDLREAEPTLKAFESHIGSCHLVRATACFPGGRITLSDCTDWFVEFQELRERALENAYESESEDREERARAMNEQRVAALTRIRALPSEADFMLFVESGRQTLQSIAAYIRENVENAQLLPPGVIREESRALKDKLLLKR